MRIILLFFVLLFFISANAQTFQWAGAFVAKSHANSIKTDSKGNVYTTGAFTDTVDFDPGPGVYNLISTGSNDIFISKLDAYGSFVWAKSIGGIGSDEGSSIAVDTLGGVYITGSFENTADFDPGPGVFNMISQNYEDIFISKLDSNGNFVWAKRFGSSVGYDKGSSITTDAIGNIYITGGFDYTVDFDPGPGVLNMTAAGYGDIFIIKLDSNGNLVWVNQSGDPISDRGDYITVDNLGQAYIAGWGSDWPNNNIYIIISKINSNGSFIWTKKMSTINANNMEVKTISIDSFGSVYTTGFFTGTLDLDPGFGVYNLAGPSGFISKLNSNGNFIWAKKMIGNNCVCTVDKAGNIYIACDNAGIYMDCDPGPGVYNLNANTMIFIQKLDLYGDFVWAKGMTGSSYIDPNSITLDTIGNIYTTGYFKNGNIDFDPGPSSYILTPSTLQSAFVLKLNECADAGVTKTGANLSAHASGASYQWYTCNPFQAISGEINQTYIATASGDYAVVVTQNGCTDTSVCYSVIGSGLQDFSLSNAIHLYPNPVKQNLLIQSQYPLQDANIKILSITGQVAREYNHISTDKFTIDMSSFVSGNYFIEIADKKNKYVRKVFKE